MLAKEEKPEDDLITRARKRAEIRRELRGSADRIADLLDDLCDEIVSLNTRLYEVGEGNITE